MEGGVRMGTLENIFRMHQNNFISLFRRRSPPSSTGEGLNSPEASPRPIPQLSSIANSVVYRCSKILQVSTAELQHRFDIELPETVKQLFTYSRNFVEFCSYQALNIVTKSPDYLSDKEFCRLTYDMMLAWESPCVDIDSQYKEASSSSNQDEEEEEVWSLFYSSSTNMALQVDNTQTVGMEAFARIAPASAAVADVITVHNLFDALTSSSGRRLHFIIYEKYLRSLDRIIKSVKSTSEPMGSSLQLMQGEIILDVDGASPTQPVLKHIGKSAWPGRLTLTNHALYFEPFGVGVHEKAIKYDLAMDLKQVIKPELTGPLGARIFDKAVLYRATSIDEPVYFEFPEFKSNSRRDYWLDISLEILYAHRFVRKNNFQDTPLLEVLAKAILGILRYRALKEAFHFFASHYKTLLVFNLVESLPKGDIVLATLSKNLKPLQLVGPQRNADESLNMKQKAPLSPVAVQTLSRLGFALSKEASFYGKATFAGALSAGVTNPLEMAVKRSISDTGRAEAAQATVDRVKIEGIDTNAAVMKELLFPVAKLLLRLHRLASWQNSFKSSLFLVLSCVVILRGWTNYMLPSFFIGCAVYMFFLRHVNRGKSLEAFKVTTPPNKNPVEQLLIWQEVVSRFESLIQAGNIALLKLRSLLFAVVPQATEMIVLVLIIVALIVAFVPVKYMMFAAFLEAYTREMPYRRPSTERWKRRIKEWWVRIPAAPVQLVRVDDKKKTK